MIADLTGKNTQQLNAIAFDFGHKSLTTIECSRGPCTEIDKASTAHFRNSCRGDKEKDGFALKQQLLNAQLTFIDANQKQRIKSM